MLVARVDDAWDKLAREDTEASCASAHVRSISDCLAVTIGHYSQSVSFDASLLAYSATFADELARDSLAKHWGSKKSAGTRCQTEPQPPFDRGPSLPRNPGALQKCIKIPTATIMPDCPDAGSKPFHVHNPTWPDG
ncbi:hypothetical protein MCOR31_002435 [Pyricularia oryzae]|nr:hypothetical protein MCOR26_008242 [Pyricularia oryzae]KAI6344069.1 hypothetical protein MCOR28_004422 [Pyricularia oryzae]KAI6375002.1 hypothetical protein MCOR31_002435 [Pyricularia oryzae]